MTLDRGQRLMGPNHIRANGAVLGNLARKPSAGADRNQYMQVAGERTLGLVLL